MSIIAHLDSISVCAPALATLHFRDTETERTYRVEFDAERIWDNIKVNNQYDPNQPDSGLSVSRIAPDTEQPTADKEATINVRYGYPG